MEVNMKHILEDLWYSYELDNPMMPTKELEEVLEKAYQSEERLRENLNEKENELFLKYEACMSEISSISEKDAFIRGVRFATKYLLAILQ
jgi:hypothetical protein